MTRDEIIVMAGKAGLPILWITETGVIKWEDLERFASLVAAHAYVEPCCQKFDVCQKVCMPRAAVAEREACAKECDKIEKRKWDMVMNGGAMQGIGARDCAIAIRARSET